MRTYFGDLPTDVQAMLTRHLGIDFSHTIMKAPRWFCAWACNDAGHVVGIFVAEFCVWFDAKITVLILDPRCCTRRVLRAIFTALFSQAKRLTTEVEPSNLRSLQQVQRLGFYQEGYRPLGLEGTRDTILFGMVKDECPWLRSYVSPSKTSFDATHRPMMDVVVGRDGLLRSRVGPDRNNLTVSELGRRFVLSAPNNTFENVFRLGFPTNVSGADTARVAASVCSNGKSTWRRAMNPNADNTMSFAGFSAEPDLRVAGFADAKRPNQAVGSFMCESFGEYNLRS